MTKKIFRYVFVAAASVLLLCLALIFGVLYEYFSSVQKSQMKTELDLIAQAVESSKGAYLENLNIASRRITWIDADGSVIFDTDRDAQSMENHGEREEIKEAFENGTGESSRFSDTLTRETLYYASRLSDGTVLRIAVSHITVLALFIKALPPIIAVLTAALLLSAVLAHRMAGSFVKPLNMLDLDNPMENEVYDELSPLLMRIEQQQRKISSQEEELQDKKREFYAVIRNMSEGLILLNERDSILSINPAAAGFCGIAVNCAGKDFLSVERSHEISSALDSAKLCGHNEIQLGRNGREYQLNFNRIEEKGHTFGIVILIFDITERAFAERNRREFTANVSHELKTPLHSIMGSAELIEKGMVQPEDMSRFVGYIRREAERLVTLVEDIIKLSQLDERGELPLEEVDLYELAAQETEALLPVAKNLGIALYFEGSPVMLKGSKQLLHEVIFNLCDNAIKYNADGGSVKVTVGSEENNAILTVEDTGIGIPKEHQARIFERFYRVDKSHSKETGGTGLGLSIVKHAVQYMNGSIELQSEQGRGTFIKISFPR